MRSFRKNVLRLALQNKMSVLGSVLIIAIGVFTMVAMFDTLQNLDGQIQRYYSGNLLADVFVKVRAMSEDDIFRLREIDGVESADGKIYKDVRMLCDGQEEIAQLHLMSYDPDAEVNRLNIDGTLNDDSIFIGDRMSNFYGFEAGDTVSIIINGQTVPFIYAGRASGPEYIYSVSSEGAMVPDGETYDIACISLDRMAELTSMDGCRNEIGIILSPGTELDDVRSELTARLEPRGLISLIDRSQQTSTNMISGEMKELVATGTLLPAIFLAVSVYMLYMSLKKMIDHDQTLIGSMKAFGLTNGELIGAYMIEGIAIGVAGAIIGWLIAMPFGRFMFDLYLDFFTLPVTEFRDCWNTRISSLFIAVLTAAASVLFGVRRVLGITPAMAMKSRSPAKARNVRLPESWTRGMNTFRKMEIRSMARNPLRAFLIVLAVAFPFAMSSVLFSFMPTIQTMLDEQFNKIMCYDMEITVDRYTDPDSLAAAGLGLNYVTESEAVCVLPMEVKNENLTEYGVLYGMNKGSGLWRIMAQGGKFIDPPANGIVINTRMAKKLHVKAGDTVKVNITALGTGDLELPVAATITEIFGGGCYVDLSSFPHQFGVQPAANSLIVSIRDGHMQDVKDQINRTSRVSGIVDAHKIIKSYEDMIGSMIIMIDMFAVISVIAGFVLIYNISLISIKERFTELGTLEVIGALKKEIDRMLLEENLVYCVLGIALGFPMGYALKRLLEIVFISDTYSISLIIPAWSYILTALMCAAMVLGAWYAETGFIRKIALTDILKERE